MEVFILKMQLLEDLSPKNLYLYTSNKIMESKWAEQFFGAHGRTKHTVGSQYIF